MRGAETTFGPFVLDRGSARLLQDSKPVAIGQRGFALLEALLATDGVVSKQTLMEAGWPGTTVEEGNLTVQMAALRKALGERTGGGEWIVTVPRVGYRLVRVGHAPPADAVVEAPRRPSLAVMPFENLSGDHAQDYFANGVVEDLITALSGYRTFAVVSRNSSFRYRGMAIDLRDVARELGVRYLLEGSVRRAGNRLRITAHLTEGESGEHLWGRTFDGVVEDVFDVHDHIAEHVVGVIEPEIRRAEMQRSRRKRPEALDAYDLTLQAQSLVFAADPSANAKAFELCQQAIAREPDYAYALSVAAWLLLARRLSNWPPITVDDAAQADELSRRAAANSGGDPEILARRADVLVQIVGDFEQGVQLVRSAVQANPNNAFVLGQAATINLLAGSLDDAAEQASRAIELSPGDPTLSAPLGALAHVRVIRGDYQGALDPAARAVGLNSKFPPAYWMLIAANAHLGEMEAATRWLSAYLSVRPGTTVESISSRQHPRWPERIEPVLRGLRLAGMPER